MVLVVACAGHALTLCVHLQAGGNSPSCLVARCFALRPVPCTMAAHKLTPKCRTSYLILGFPSVGWGYAPYKKPMKTGKPVAKDPTVLKLYELTASQPTSMGGRWNTGVTAYTYEKAPNQMDKGKRDSSSPMELKVGNVLTAFLQDFHYGAEKKGLFPEDMEFIPAYTMVDVHVAVGHNQTEGYGLRVVKVVPHKSSLVSYMFEGSLLSIPSSRAACEELMGTITTTARLAVQCLEQTVPTFLVRDVKCFTSESAETTGFIRVCALDDGTPLMEGASGSDIIDIPVELAARCLNAPLVETGVAGGADYGAAPTPTYDTEYIMAFLDTASALGALSLLVTYDEYYAKCNIPMQTRSPFRGVPIVDVDKMLVGMGPDAFTATGSSEGQCAFPLPVERLGGDMQRPALVLSLTPSTFATDGAQPQCSRDFSLWHPSVAQGTGYKIELVDLADGMPTVVSFVYIPSSSSSGGGARTAGRNRLFKRPLAAPVDVAVIEAKRARTEADSTDDE